MESFATGSYKFCVWVTRLVYLNLLWIGFTVAGIVIFGLLPATTAMFGVVRKWILHEDDIPITSQFWKTYKKEFINANLLGYVLVVLGYLFIAEWTILQASDANIYRIAGLGVMVIFIMYTIVVMYFFPIYVHFNLRKFDYFKWPFVIGIVHPILSVFLFIVIGAGLYFVYHTIPMLILLFGGSVTAYIVMWGVSKTFDKYELKEG